MPAQRKVSRRQFGGLLGSILGGLGSQLMPIPGVQGAEVGRALGSLLPFRRGGKPKRKAATKKKARGGK